MFDSPTYTPNGRLGDRAIFAVSNMFVMEDTRFVTLCRKLGPCGHWGKSGRWPHCATAVAPYYDFEAGAGVWRRHRRFCGAMCAAATPISNNQARRTANIVSVSDAVMSCPANSFRPRRSTIFSAPCGRHSGRHARPFGPLRALCRDAPVRRARLRALPPPPGVLLRGPPRRPSFRPLRVL